MTFLPHHGIDRRFPRRDLKTRLVHLNRRVGTFRPNDFPNAQPRLGKQLALQP